MSEFSHQYYTWGHRQKEKPIKIENREGFPFIMIKLSLPRVYQQNTYCPNNHNHNTYHHDQHPFCPPIALPWFYALRPHHILESQDNIWDWITKDQKYKQYISIHTNFRLDSIPAASFIQLQSLKCVSRAQWPLNLLPTFPMSLYATQNACIHYLAMHIFHIFQCHTEVPHSLDYPCSSVARREVPQPIFRIRISMRENRTHT